MNAPTVIEFDQRLYTADAVQSAAYRAMNALTVDIRVEGERLLCQLTPNDGIGSEAFSLAVQEFKKDALDYQLRQKLKTETESVRNLILSLAFSKTGLQ
ncbi:His-Xaa-Ser system protein HxsD [Pseudomonas schmalbachii]|uniref:His-Xaa-Ser system protein HxsD n=1 Tax=Pseudomonas schmalbachii TaxID=2816993 RepID=A0ABS3TRF2_9PSED|nr:His-Xaa-Ser system protein HxsD [Pseudomonas schmalbachii]MBO3276246.1 His-Xaa-Ser system protein HxsD [Pseudomonas schmalbachii]